jgi:hypothetical protein
MSLFARILGILKNAGLNQLTILQYWCQINKLPKSYTINSKAIWKTTENRVLFSIKNHQNQII